MQSHNIKITEPNYNAVINGTKRCEIRMNDRNYQKGDTAFLEEIRLLSETDPKADPNAWGHTGRVTKVTISHVTNFMQKEGVVVLSIIPTENKVAEPEVQLDAKVQNPKGANAKRKGNGGSVPSINRAGKRTNAGSGKKTAPKRSRKG